MNRRSYRPLIAFVAVIAAAGSVTAAGLTFTAHTVSRSVAELPEVKTRVLPSYVVRLPVAKAADLDVSKTVEVSPKIRMPVTVAKAPETPDAGAAAPAASATLVAEVTPLSAEMVEEPAIAGAPYVVSTAVFVRSGPSKNNRKLGTVTAGTEVRVSDEQGGWMKVTFAGGSGWVYQRYLEAAPVAEVAEAEIGNAPF
jgi:uncharacterized protein YgiM (DUF1202 family)